MNSYTLSRQWFDFAFENPDKITVYQGALYMWLIEVNNRGGWAEKFPFNTDDACIATGMNNRKTVWKALNELAELGFVHIVYKSSHRHKPSVISLILLDMGLNGSLDKSLSNQSVERTSNATVRGQVADWLGNGTRTSNATVRGHSNKPQTTNKETNIGTDAPAVLSDFEKFELIRKDYPGTKRGGKTEWQEFKKKYGKEITTEFLRAIWLGLEAKRKTNKELMAAGGFVPEWPHFKTYLNQRRWEEETEVRQAPEPFKEPRSFNNVEEHLAYWSGVPTPTPITD